MVEEKSGRKVRVKRRDLPMHKKPCIDYAQTNIPQHPGWGCFRTSEFISNLFVAFVLLKINFHGKLFTVHTAWHTCI